VNVITLHVCVYRAAVIVLIYIVISQDHIKWQTALFAILSPQKVSAHTPAAAGVTAAAPAAGAQSKPSVRNEINSELSCSRASCSLARLSIQHSNNKTSRSQCVYCVYCILTS
jgi:hypothetical protein